MTSTYKKILVLFFAAIFLSAFLAGSVSADSSTSVTLNISSVTPVPPPSPQTTSMLIIVADDAVKEMGYTVNGVVNATSVPLSRDGVDIEIIPASLPYGKLLNSTFRHLDTTISSVDFFFKEHFPAHPMILTIYVYLSFDTYVPVNPTPDTPVTPVKPANPVTPLPPENQTDPLNPSTPDTPIRPDEDEPFFPTIQPAGSVHNVAGLIPIIIGGAMLYLVFFWKRKVYRILTHHAKRHGEKPEKDLLKATADALIRVIRSDEYAGWRKNSTLTSRLRSDIVRTLDEMQYPQVVPRDAVVAEILKSAKGRINRHRL